MGIICLQQIQYYLHSTKFILKDLGFLFFRAINISMKKSCSHYQIKKQCCSFQPFRKLLTGYRGDPLMEESVTRRDYLGQCGKAKQSSLQHWSEEALLKSLVSALGFRQQEGTSKEICSCGFIIHCQIKRCVFIQWEIFALELKKLLQSNGILN